jgi:hypothetical protein
VGLVFSPGGSGNVKSTIFNLFIPSAGGKNGGLAASAWQPSRSLSSIKGLPVRDHPFFLELVS